MRPAEQAALDQLLASVREVTVARSRLSLEMREVAGAFRNFAAAWRQVDERLSVEEAAEIAAHPDLAELNVYFDGFYPPS